MTKKEIEEKAKRYDEAIKRAKELLEIGVKDTRDKRVVLSFFPELKESGDERIRKAMIKGLSSCGTKYWGGFEVQAAIDYLEKQGEQKQELLTKEKALKNSPFVEQKPAVETKLNIEEGKWYICISQFCNCIEGRVYKATSDSRIIDDFGTEYDMHSDAYKYFRLWTIQDAKDGDVLACENGWT